MSLDAYAPLTPDETASATAPKAKADKVPIVPVPDDAPDCTFKIPARGGSPTAMWAYRDREGRLLGYDARFEYEEDGQRCKEVMPVAYCQEGERRAWRSKALPSPRPLYGLDRLALREAAPVLICEGAKSADAGGRLLPDYVAISWQGGANAIGQSRWRDLAGRDVLIWPDRDRQTELNGNEKPYEDQPGIIAANNIVVRLKDHARSIRVLDLSDYECADGWDVADAEAQGWTTLQATEFVAARAIEMDFNAPGTVMPHGFEDREDGLYYAEGDKGGQRICGRLKVLASTRDPNGRNWGLLLEWRDLDGVPHRWAMPQSLLAGDGNSIREAFLDRGLYVSSDGKARSRLIEFLGTVRTPVRARAVSQVGWSDGAFALPEETIGDTPTERVIFQHSDALPHKYLRKGALEDWQRNVAKLAVGNSRLVFCISAAFVGPILGPACEEGGGFNIIGVSSSGKTTVLHAGASVWGPPEYIRTWRATSNGLEGVAAQHSETLLCLDELGQLEPREAGQVAYMLGNKQGKTRAGRSGSARAAASWNVLFLSSGEIGVADLIREGRQARSQAGQEVRILDVPADAGKGMGAFENLHGVSTPEAFSREVKTASARHYGSASIAYLQELALIRNDVGSMIVASVNDFDAAHVPPGSDGQVKRAGRRFGLVAAAGELAISLGILPWGAGEAEGAAAVMFAAWLGRRGGNGSAEERNILQRLRLFLEQHSDSRFAPVVENDAQMQRSIINRAGFWRSALEDGETVREHIILPETYKEIFAGMDCTSATRILRKHGILIPDSQGANQQAVTLPGLGRPRVYVISAKVFSDVV